MGRCFFALSSAVNFSCLVRLRYSSSREIARIVCIFVVGFGFLCCTGMRGTGRRTASSNLSSEGIASSIRIHATGCDAEYDREPSQ